MGRIAGGRVFFVALGALASVLFAAGPHAFVVLAYERAPILRGELWRLLTSHLVHRDLTHLAWNLAASAIVGLAVARWLSLRHWLVAASTVAFGSSAGVLLLAPRARAMAGLSALLHGLLAAGAVVQVRRGERIGWVFLGVLAAKIAWEQIGGATPWSGAVLGGEIAVTAHACGTLAGLLAGLVLAVRIDKRPRPFE